MSFLFEKSATWRWIVSSSRSSKTFYVAFASICVLGPLMLGQAVMSTTNRSQPKLNRDLLQRGRDDSVAMGRVNKERLQQLLGEIERKENIEDRYAAALRGETLTGTPDARIRGGGGTSLPSLPLPQEKWPSNSRHGSSVEESSLPATSSS